MRIKQSSIILPLFIWSSAFAGPLKFGSVAIGVPLHLLPKGFLLLLMVKPFLLLHARLRQCVVAGAVLALCVVGMSHNLPATQVMFGVWALVPFVFGMLFPGLVISAGNQRSFILLFFVCIIGEGLSYFVTFPWAGMNAEFGGVTTMVARDWSDEGSKRLAGFAASSHDLSIMLAVLGMFFIFRSRQLIARLALMMLVAALIVATTMKTTAIAFLLACLPLLAPSKFLRSVSGIFGLVSIMAGSLIPFLLTSPALSGVMRIAQNTSRLHTLETRFDRTWPQVIDYLRHADVGAFGIGLGGLGSAMSIGGEQFPFASVDNLYLYVLGTAGWMGVLLIAIYASKLISAAFGPPDRDVPFRLPLMVFFAIYGISQSPLEISVAAVFVGALVTLRRGELPSIKPVLRKSAVSRFIVNES